MTNALIPIGKLFDLEKGQLQSTKSTDGEYTFITASKDWKTHNEYSHDCEALIFAAAASGSLGRTHYINGKFVTSDLCFILTPKNPKEYPVNLSFYHFVFNSLKEVIVKKTKSGTSKESINQTNLKKYELPYFDLAQQNKWIDILHKTLQKKNALSDELTSQRQLLKELRKSVLQEAIEGDLTEDWRKKNSDIEPASKYLEIIQHEKEKLTASNKIKKSKSLPKITDDEKPFNIPKKWEWSRFNSLGTITGGGTPSKGNPQFWDGNIIWVTPKDMKNSLIENSILKITESAIENSSVNIIPANSLIIVGRSGILKRKLPVSINLLNCTVNQDMKVLIPYPTLDEKFIQYALMGLEKLILKKFVKYGMTVHSLRYQEFALMPIPFPPLEEQKEIVRRIELFINRIEKLEQKTNEAMQGTENLMQSVLKEAFEQDAFEEEVIEEMKECA